MSRPVTISEDTILTAARAVFTEKGVRATTAEIALRAGVSEGSLFKHFGSKAALHKASMATGVPTQMLEEEMRAQAPLRSEEDFARLIRWQIGVLRTVVPVVLMAWSTRSHLEELPSELSGANPPPLVVMRTLSALLLREMEAGHLRRRNPEVLARVILGAAWHYVFMALVLRKGSSSLDEETFVVDLARIIFSDVGIQRGASDEEKTKKKKKKKERR